MNTSSHIPIQDINAQGKEEKENKKQCACIFARNKHWK